MSDEQVSKTVKGFIAEPLIIVIVLYLISSAIDPLLHINSQVFRIIFTSAAGIPTLIFFLKKKGTNTHSMRNIKRGQYCLEQED